MIFEGKAISLTEFESGFFDMHFDLQDSSVNKFSSLVMAELDQVLTLLEKTEGARGLILTSGKTVFFVGADINEFVGLFAAGDEVIQNQVAQNNRNFTRIEDLPFPTLVAINGYALGGGLEIALACDFRLASKSAKVGLPETKLGIIPGWGGTTRLPRIAGLDVAVEWIAGAKEYGADAALNAGVVDAVVEDDALRVSAVAMIKRAAEGKLAYEVGRERKKGPLKHNDIEGLLAFESSKAFIKAQAGRNYPAPVTAVKVMQEAAKLGRDDALLIEAKAFADLAQGSVAESLVGLFLNDQFVSKKAKTIAKQSGGEIKHAAVLGAGIMGGGIAYQSAYKNVPVTMKDINQAGLDLGLEEASKLLSKRVERGRMDVSKMAEVLNKITPSLSYEGFGGVDIVVEAVVENPKIKHAVLAEVESHLGEDAVLSSNTSTISIDTLAEALKKPENFCGMHFFNPVHRMPLVEVIRGSKTSDKTVATTVAYANALGKKAVVVRDCPGFLVNRVLFPYFAGFSMLMRDGGDYQAIDKVMEKWGWPMGPAYLLDVVGIDTACHAEKVMAAGFPDRLSKSFEAPSDIFFKEGKLGQKSGSGFYRYETDKKGKLKKLACDDSVELMKSHFGETKAFSEEEIIARLMVPMATELARCLEEGIVDSQAEADMALIYGVGFPPFRGGIFRWLDNIGLNTFAAMASPLAHLGPLYELTEGMEDMLNNKSKYYVQGAGE